MFLLWLILFLAPVFFAATFALYLVFFYSPSKSQNDDRRLAHTSQMPARRTQILEMIDEARKIPYETVEILSRDDFVLRGRYMEQTPGAPICICFHGYRGTPNRDLYGLIHILHKLGFNLLLAEHRAHCRSESNTITMGVKERFDCLDWTEYVQYRFGRETPVLLVGVSMGATSVLMASEFALPDNVRGAIADCPFSGPKDIVFYRAQQLHLLPRSSTLFVEAAARIYGGFSLFGPSAVEAVKRTRLPILLLHGASDYVVPHYMSEQIHDANRDQTELHLFPRAGHALSYLLDPDRYEACCRSYIRRVLKDEVPEPMKVRLK